jgi:hemolysin III
MAQKRERPPTPGEELANTLTHGAGALGGVAITAILVVIAALRSDAWGIVGAAIFGAALVALYTASTIYHAVRPPVLKARLKVLDHAMIYVLIAGSYTPFMLGGLRGGWGWSLFGVIWGLAVAGVVFKLFFIDRFPRLSTALYLAMGWLILLALGPMIQSLEPATLLWLLAGGIAYSAGTIFYHGTRRYAHAVWHLFVLAGSACHVVAVATQL